MRRKIILAMIILALFFVASCEKDSGGDGVIDTGVSMTVTYPADAAGDLTVKISTESDFSVDTATESFTVDGSGSAGATLTKTFVTELAAGDFYARAFIDEDSNDTIDKGEYANAYDAIAYNATPTAITVSDGIIAPQAITLDRQAGYCQLSGRAILGTSFPTGTLNVVFYRTAIQDLGGNPITMTFIGASDEQALSEYNGSFSAFREYTVNIDPAYDWKLKIFIDENGDDKITSGERSVYYNNDDGTGISEISGLPADDSETVGDQSL